MDLILFCTAFILQFVGHQVGDYLFQSEKQALGKEKSKWYRAKHCIIYSLFVSLLLLIGFSWYVALIVFVITFIAHMIVDSRKPARGWKVFFEQKITGNKKFKYENLPMYVVFEMGRTFHYVRILAVSLIIGFGLI